MINNNNVGVQQKKYYFYDTVQNKIISEEQLIGKTMDELEGFLAGFQIRKLHPNESVFILKKYLFGVFTLKLYLYMNENTVYEYCIQM